MKTVRRAWTTEAWLWALVTPPLFACAAGAAGCSRLGFDEPPPWSCPDPVIASGGEIAHYDFEENGGDRIVDGLGGRHGIIHGDGVTWAAGLAGCGLGLAFSDDPERTGFAEIADDPAWDLTVGSIDLWLRPGSAPSDLEMVLTRDAESELDGHFTLGYTPDRRLFARTQRLALSQVECSEPVHEGAWVHVAVNFGPPAVELFLDGEKVISDPEAVVDGTPCGGHEPYGLDGNDNPWVIGASNWAAVEGTGRPISNFLHGGMIDRLRIRSTRVSF